MWQSWGLSQSFVQSRDVALQRFNGLGVSSSWRLRLWPGSWENEYVPTLLALPGGISDLLVICSFPSWLHPLKMGCFLMFSFLSRDARCKSKECGQFHNGSITNYVQTLSFDPARRVAPCEISELSQIMSEAKAYGA